MTEPFTALGIDVGGTKIAAGVVSFPEGRLGAQKVIPSEPARGGEAVLNDVVSVAEELIAGTTERCQKVKGIGIGICELVDPAGRIVSSNCVKWQDQPVIERLHASFGQLTGVGLDRPGLVKSSTT